MDNLNWVFSLYAVVIGLTLVEILTGFGRAIRLRRNAALDGHAGVRLGLLTPLLAVFLMLDITSFWIVAWSLRNAISVSPMVLAFGLFATSLYYVAASWVFPESDMPDLDLDVHYFRQKALVFSLVLTSNVATYLGRSWVIGSIGMPGAGLYEYLLLSTYYLLQLAGILVKGKRANLAILICLLFVSAEFTSAIGLRIVQAIG
jgi:hypothetical protein